MTRQTRAIAAFELGVVCPTVLFLGSASVRTHDWRASMALWICVIAGVELLPVPVWRGLQISVGFPMLIAVAFLYSPVAACGIAFVASSDPREFRGQVGLLRALFNRSQIALAVLAASVVFHSFAEMGDTSSRILLAASIAVAADYLVNVTLVTIATSLINSAPVLVIARKMKIGNPVEFLVSYLGLGGLGIVLAQLYLKVGFWSVAVFVVPLIFARQMFFRSRALEEAHKELEDREVVLRRLSDRMAEERQDERAQIAAFLHDDLAQTLFRLSLQIDLADRYLENDDMEAVERTLAEIKVSKNETAEKVRSLIRDLHRSPLGRAGLAEALKSFAAEVGSGADVEFDLQVAELPLSPPIQLLAYQIAREAMMNSLKYANASRIEVAFAERDHSIQLTVHDDGSGFDADAGEPDGHYGLAMMRERAQAAGGTFDLVSAKGHGTNVTVRFPSSWLQHDATITALRGPDRIPRA